MERLVLHQINVVPLHHGYLGGNSSRNGYRNKTNIMLLRWLKNLVFVSCILHFTSSFCCFFSFCHVSVRMPKSWGRAAFSWLCDIAHFWKLMTAMRNEYSEKQHLHGYRIYYQRYPSWSASPRTQDVVSQALEMNALSLWEGPDSASSQSWKQNEGNLQGCASISCHDLMCTDFTPQ